MTFKEFLQVREADVRKDEAERDATIDEWVRATNKLVTQIRDWLSESDTSQLLRFVDTRVGQFEAKLGAYDNVALEIRLGGQVAALQPVARFVRGPLMVIDPTGKWTGRVDLVGGEQKFEIYRHTRTADRFDSWWIRDPDDSQLTQLSKDVIEKCVMKIFA